ncbi:MAG TPA: mercury(II) reductase [Desulfobacterales bacterium]|nr:mercury(II) reductase [Desulfobacterales bacterium]
MKSFDLIIIGGGAGAFAAAIRANEHKANTAMINTGLPLGGTCVNVGCVPSKRLLRVGEIMHLARKHGFPGLEMDVKKFDFPTLIKDELDLVSRLRKEKYEKVLRRLESVGFIEGHARFISKNEVVVNEEILQADKIIIATGSKAKVPSIEGIIEAGFVTHIEALKMQKLPESFIIIGAGPVSIEFAQMFSRFGSKVTIVKRSPGLLRFAEPELTRRLEQILVAEGVDIITIEAFICARRENGKKVLAISVDGREVEVDSDEILLATGKTPNTENLALELAGVLVDEKQAIVVNEIFQTSQPHILAVGDVINLPTRQEPTAGREGTLAVENALGGGTKHSIDYDSVPFTVFTDPQLAGVGLTEEEQMKRMGTCNCRTVSFENVPRAIIMNRTEGLIKMVIHPSTDQILGVHILAPDAGELIAEAMILVKNKNTVEDVINSLPMFPTLSESIKLVALSFKKDISSLSCCV